MAQCDVSGNGCFQQADDNKVCGSCLRSLCDGCAEHLVPINDEWGNHYLVPMSVGGEDSQGSVEACPSCAHLETFRTSATTNTNLALQHLISHHPDSKLEEVDDYGDLDDYHDALHYGDTDEKTRGTLDYPTDHKEADANLKVASDTAAPTQNNFCTSCGTKADQSHNFCADCGGNLVRPSSSKSTTTPQPPATPTGVPTQPLSPMDVYPKEIHPDTPIDISNIMAAHGDGSPAHNSAAHTGFVEPGHPYADLPEPAAASTYSSKLANKYLSGQLSPEQKYGLAASIPLSSKSAIKESIKKAGGIDSSGAPIRGIHPDHEQCEASGGTKLFTTNVVCHSCGKSADHLGKLRIASPKEPYSTLRPSPFDSREHQAKSQSFIERVGAQHEKYAEAKLMGLQGSRSPGRPNSQKERIQSLQGFNPEELYPSSPSFVHKGQKVSHEDSQQYLAPEDRGLSQTSPDDFQHLIKHLHTPEERAEAWSHYREVTQGAGTPHVHDPVNGQAIGLHGQPIE